VFKKDILKEKLIDGKAFAAAFCERLARTTAQLKEKHGLVCGLAVVLVGEDPASQIYVRNKLKKAESLGIRTFAHMLPDSTSHTELTALIDKLNIDTEVHGILVQLPLPAQINKSEIIERINPMKDVDGFHPLNVGRLNTWQPCLIPCTPKGAMMLIKSVLGENLTGKNAVVLGRSDIVGKPMAALLVKENCSVTILHSKSQNIPEMCRQADILVCATGMPHIIHREYVKPGACVIDVGIVRVNDKILGDVDLEDVIDKVDHITPVPGGVGPMTVACLMDNTLEAACKQNGINLEELIQCGQK
jgi:methylenetetrahydrofolate dehydrogenase (NADP+)/methenyltetrahydrofolate cyclohydrolase